MFELHALSDKGDNTNIYGLGSSSLHASTSTHGCKCVFIYVHDEMREETWSHFLYKSPERIRWKPYLRSIGGEENK